MLELQPIGIICSCFTEKFGIPRQPGLVPSARARLELYEPFNREEMVRGLELYSHIWLQFFFHMAHPDGWKATVRPPRLGGKVRQGIFATRSPHRPNFIGISVVKLEGVRCDGSGVELELSGVDVLDQTPVLDIKPYLPYADCRPEATVAGLAEHHGVLPVEFSETAARFCRSYDNQTTINLRKLITEILENDPRPASQRFKRDEFGMCIYNVNVRWSVRDGRCTVLTCDEIDSID